MSEALHEVGDAFAVYGFSSDNRDNVDFHRIKDFNDAYDDRAKKRTSAIEDRFENRDGTSIRHTISKLRKRPEPTGLMILPASPSIRPSPNVCRVYTATAVGPSSTTWSSFQKKSTGFTEY